MKAPPKRRTKRASSYSEKNPDEMAAIPLVAKTERQQDYIDSLKRCSQVIALGPAGSGKTYITTTYAASLYKQKLIDKIIITRPMVPTGRDIGFLPGNLHEKTLPWAMPVVDILYKHLGKAVVDTAMKGTDQRSPNIEIVPLALIRGRTFDDAFIIVDECFSGDTEILTVDGFKRLDHVNLSDSVAQYDGDNITFVNPIRKVEKEYQGEMVTIKNGRFSMTATKNHRAIYKDHKNRLVEATFGDPVKTNWIVPTCATTKPVLEASPEVILACAIQADGSFETTMKSNGEPHNYWTVSLKKHHKIERFEHAVNKLGIEYSRYKEDSRGRVRFYLKGHRTIKYLESCKEKNFILKDIIDDGVESEFVHEVMLWDGHKRTYFSTNKHNIDVIQALSHMAGFHANYH